MIYWQSLAESINIHVKNQIIVSICIGSQQDNILKVGNCVLEEQARSFGATTFSIMTLGLMTLSITICECDIRYPRTYHSMLSIVILNVMLNVIMLCSYTECPYAVCYSECHYAECRYTEWHAECHYGMSLY